MTSASLIRYQASGPIAAITLSAGLRSARGRTSATIRGEAQRRSRASASAIGTARPTVVSAATAPGGPWRCGTRRSAPRSWPATAKRSCPRTSISATTSPAIARLDAWAWSGASAAAWSAVAAQVGADDGVASASSAATRCQVACVRGWPCSSTHRRPVAAVAHPQRDLAAVDGLQSEALEEHAPPHTRSLLRASGEPGLRMASARLSAGRSRRRPRPGHSSP